ncbi:ferredoxin [Stutzerimonas chloritidismutans AW-1]|uniref:Ferredoxin n=1 Tax=Stutzerimonas chloritidismutans AW-1 TaxID=1263865 RepID=V4RX29_STUCH|nr:2Fe-2S iron-sulfur cluster binding domain-containing protein [Stutzerimonas chloritidismutans]ESQ97686.1 ferredoxin [Stutzerimonas chloritidismutans AW-1]
MFSFFAKRKVSAALINGIGVDVRPGETLLHAALRQGIDFPHSCRVGGCASCKCKLISGQVKELTETGYILSDEELDAGYILACQSVPKGEVSIEVDLAAAQARRHVRGKVVAQDRLTHDITRLVIQLEEGLPYKAGQYADLCLDALPQYARSFSFASRPQPDGKVSFFIRKVQGGRVTSLINDQSLLGQGAMVEGPVGDFYLRTSTAPLLLVAGGSGLAPILALLEEALVAGAQRSVTLLFGAREERDLYALDAISALAAQWRASFNFVPVLSGATSDSSWQGARGLVTELIPAFLEDGAHAYLCGPPVMIDSAVLMLRGSAVPRDHIHADRFTTHHDLLAATA